MLEGREKDAKTENPQLFTSDMDDFLLAFPLTSAFASNKVYHVPIHNEVERGLHAF